MTATQALGWALIHFLWQGALIALVVRASLALLANRPASVRYAVAVAGLALMPVVVAGTMLRVTTGPPDYGTHEAGDRATAGPVDRGIGVAPSPSGVTSTPSTPSFDLSAPGAATASLRQRLERLMPWFVGAWVAGVLILAIRLLGGLATARRLVRRGIEPVPAVLEGLVSRLAAQLGVRRVVAVFSSTLTRVPAVVGWLKPVILLPASALSGLTPAQVEMILAHELAHIRRHDYLVNVVQSVIETLLFYHPGVWWIGGRIREEREHCCDDLAVMVAGSSTRYAEALLSLELTRVVSPALGATGGSLVSRVERLLLPRRARSELLPRWIAGAAAVLVLALGAGGTRLIASPEGSSLAAEPVRPHEEKDKERSSSADDVVQDTSRAAPDTVLRAPDPTASLPDRLEWARRDADRRNARGYWVGWTIETLPRLAPAFVMGRFDRVGGLSFEEATIEGGTTIIGSSGLIFWHGDLRGWHLPGPALAPLVGAEPSRVAVLYLYERRAGRLRLVRVHAATAALPMHFEGRPLYWLGTADDASSLREARAQYSAAATARMREDLVGMVGVHASSALVVPALRKLLESGESADIRSEAAEWLSYHDTREALAALSHAARGDPSSKVRSEAAESVGDMRLREAFDTLVVLARELDDEDARREAVESFGARAESEAPEALAAIALRDRNQDVRREAVETLGDFEDRRGADALLRIVRSHPDPDVRREAVETIATALEPARAIEELRRILREERNVDVQREAVETLGELHDVRVVGVLVEIAERHPAVDVQREAVETLGETIEEADVVGVLERIARTHPVTEVRREAVETLGERNHHQPRALDALLGLLRTEQHEDVIREIVETLADLDDPRARAAIRSMGNKR